VCPGDRKGEGKEKVQGVQDLDEQPTFARYTAATQGLRNEVGILENLAVFYG